MKKQYKLILVLLVIYDSNAQNKSLRGIDSLKTVFNNEKNKSIKSELLENIKSFYMENNLDSVQVYLKKKKKILVQNPNSTIK
jgi:hypothetical protein